MTRSTVLCACVLAAALGGCVTRTRTENAALTMPWPKPPAADLLAYARHDKTFPTVGGDILKGASPADQAAARASVSRALDAATTP